MKTRLQGILERVRRRGKWLRRRAAEGKAPAGMGQGRRPAGRIIGVLNYKGGTGKTTTVVNLAAGLARRGARVLCIDLDAQGGLATSLNVPFNHTVADLLLGRADLPECIVPARENLDLIPSDRSLLEAEGELWRAGESARDRLEERMAGLEGYDFILIDYSPSISLVGECGLRYNREVIVPVAMEYLGLVGTRQVIETLQEIDARTDHAVRLSLIVPTFYDARQRMAREVLELLRRYFGERVAEPIRASVKLAEAASHGMTIFEYAPESPGAVDYTRLVERVTSGD